MKKLIPVLILSIALSNLVAQNNVYYTRNAILQVNGEFDGGLLLGQTRELIISLDYETTKIAIRFYPKSLRFNIDTLNEMIAAENSEIIFKGELSLDHINTAGHPPLDFIVEGYLELGREKIKINGKGELHHMNDSGEFVCMLGMTIVLNLNDLGLKMPAGLFEEVEIVITQALLETNKN
ncbi:MAG: hypothetical protein ACI8P3_003432 [Saprospiraceae bacterium]|jgi:hypothetical protein